jgi:hypothetical protein
VYPPTSLLSSNKIRKFGPQVEHQGALQARLQFGEMFAIINSPFLSIQRRSKKKPTVKKKFDGQNVEIINAKWHIPPNLKTPN